MAAERGMFCRHCGVQVLARRQGVNHLLHLVLTLLTCVWGVVWLAAAGQRDPYRCTRCGAELN